MIQVRRHRGMMESAAMGIEEVHFGRCQHKVAPTTHLLSYLQATSSNSNVCRCWLHTPGVHAALMVNQVAVFVGRQVLAS